jgi:hypothetical protein
MSETKICKYCKTEIPKDAKICPNCRKKQKGKIGIIIAVIVVLLLIIGIAGGGSDDKKESKIDNSNASSTSETSKTTATEDSNSDDRENNTNNSVVQVGGSFEDKGLKFTVNEAALDYQIEDKYGLYKLDDGLVYLLVDFTFENTGDSDKYVSIYDFKCYADNTTCEQQYVTDTTGDFINTNLSAGRNCSFKTLYAVPADASSIELEYEANIWTDEKVVVQIK